MLGGNNMWFVTAVIACGITAVITAEFIDARDNKRQRQIMQEGIKTTGTVTNVARCSVAVKGRHRWEVSVAFDYNGCTYTLEQKFVSKPPLQKGDRTTVYICGKDPWKNFFQQ